MFYACRLTLLLAILLPLTGCVGAAAPRLHPVSLAMTDQSDEAVVLTYGIEAINQARTDLPLVEMQYQLRVDGDPVYRGRRALKQTIPQGDSTRLQIPAVIPFRLTGGEPRGERELDFSATLYYIRPGQLAQALFDQGLVRPTTSISWRHVVDMEALREQPLALEP